MSPDVLHSDRYGPRSAGRNGWFRRVVLLGLAMLAVLTLAGCSSGNDATVYGGSFTFTSPGGKTEFTYAAADRKEIGALSGSDLTGRTTVDVASYKGKVVVLNFWGSWCAPCRDEAPGLQASSVRYQAGGVQFVGVDVKDTMSGALGFTAGKQITYPSIFDPGMRTMLSVRGLPTGSLPVTLVLDRQGRVAQIWLREITQGDLNLVLPALVAEKGAQ
jgi:thiol-disulfide isomerase/thioredoxin